MYECVIFNKKFDFFFTFTLISFSLEVDTTRLDSTRLAHNSKDWSHIRVGEGGGNFVKLG